MAGYVCTVAGGKGGVGKTTTTINVAAALEAAGHEVVVVDADLGMANLGEMLDAEYDYSVHDVLAGEASVDESVTDLDWGVSALPGDQSLDAFADADPAKLRDVVETLRDTYDVVLVDTGAGLSHGTTVPLGLADGVLLVSTPDEVAVRDTLKTAQLVSRVDGNVVGAVVTNATAETDVEDLKAQLDVPLVGVVPSDAAAAEDEPMVRNAPDSPAAEAYRDVSEVLAAIFFDDADPAVIETVFEASWFENESGDGDEETEEDSGGRFGLFN